MVLLADNDCALCKFFAQLFAEHRAELTYRDRMLAWYHLRYQHQVDLTRDVIQP